LESLRDMNQYLRISSNRIQKYDLSLIIDKQYSLYSHNIMFSIYPYYLSCNWSLDIYVAKNECANSQIKRKNIIEMYVYCIMYIIKLLFFYYVILLYENKHFNQYYICRTFIIIFCLSYRLSIGRVGGV